MTIMQKAKMTNEDILSSIHEELKKLHLDTHVNFWAHSPGEITVEELRLDSLALLDFIFALQQRVAVSLTVDDFPKASTLAEVAEHIFRLKETPRRLGGAYLD